MQNFEKSKEQLIAELKASRQRILDLESSAAERIRVGDSLEKPARTRPQDEARAVTFEELFDLEDIQRLQDEFAKATDVSSIITSPVGTPITAPSNFCRLCKDIIRKTEKGCANCFNSDAVIGRFSTTGPTIQQCMSGGLWDAGAGISVGGRHIANWIIGQVRDENQSEDQMRLYAREIGADEEAMVEAFREVPAMSRDRFRLVAQVLYTLASQLSAAAYQNIQLERSISERRRAEKALWESEKSYQALVENAPIGIFQSTPQGRYLMANTRLAEMYGYDSVQDLMESIRDIGSQLYVGQCDREEILRCTTRMGMNFLEVQRRRKDGSVMWVSMTMRAVEDQAGSVLYYEGFSLDVTARRQAEESLRESEASVRQLVESAPDAIFIQSEGCFAFLNQATLRLFGAQRAKDLLGTSILDRIHPDSRETVRERIHLANEMQEKPPILEERYLKLDGTIVDVEVKAVPFPFEGKHSALVFVRDITERKQAEEVMIHNEKMMTVGGLAAGMAHEINNPLGGILQSLQNIKRRTALDLPNNIRTATEQGCSLETIRNYLQARQVFEFLDAIEESGKRASRIVTNMLEFCRRGPSGRVVVDVNELVEKSISLCGANYDLASKFDFRKIRLEREFDPNNLRVPCIPSQIEQVLLNLFQNAMQALENRQAADSPARIIVRTKEECEAVCIEIEDNGPGMEPEVLRRAFEPFFTTKPVGKGTGLGLSVSYFIISNHGGSLEVESAPGQGTRFTIRLPLKPASSSVVRG